VKLGEIVALRQRGDAERALLGAPGPGAGVVGMRFAAASVA